MTLGQKLKKLRSEKGLTQKELADQLHVTFQTVSKWEKDENEPDIATLKELAKLYNRSLDYLLSEEDEEIKVEEPIPQEEKIEQPAPQEVVTKTIVIHQNALHVCTKCNKSIPENELAVDKVAQRIRNGRAWTTVYHDEYYHKNCLAEVTKEREIRAKKARDEATHKGKVKSFGWGIAAGIIGLALSLVIMLTAGKDYIHPGLAVGLSVLIGYLLFADLYCIVSGSYIGSVFVTVASWSVKFPGVIFTLDFHGLAFLIVVKILFAILGALISFFTLLFAIALSAALSAVSFPFVLIHNIHTNYEDVL